MRGLPYRPGDAKGVCDSCGKTFYLSQLRKNHRGFMVCPADYETRHPQELRKERTDNNTVRNARPGQPMRFLEPGEVTADDL